MLGDRRNSLPVDITDTSDLRAGDGDWTWSAGPSGLDSTWIA